MTDAPDTAAEGIQEYERLFAQFLHDRGLLPNGVRFRIRADTGVEEWVRDLSAREKACCGWLDYRRPRRRGAMGLTGTRGRDRPQSHSIDSEP